MRWATSPDMAAKGTQTPWQYPCLLKAAQDESRDAC